MTDTDRYRGLYAITDSRLCPPERIVQQVEAALTGGARIIQYRDKRQERAGSTEQVREILMLCERANALLIINDDIELALASKAHGVHLGREDTTLSEARERLGPTAVIGVSCYNRLELASEAAENGADYVAFGRFFPSRTKPDAVSAEPELLVSARQTIRKPLVAIGGISHENGAQLIAAGADMLAVIEAVFGQPDVEAASRRLSALFSPQENNNESF
ncbi:MAG: thiamine phosphate synthase [Candidatus Thiodiazotropha lotti]|uniref:Thiamine-phosphate synthase n=1 Tax=Candidatus Thiodiazotropha lotti TaxID=2792787 RepID=A0A9E4N2K6_9GAMM|nr:thiamine phosphate synthase [Candidatus Thiodiazotropha lotti]ODC01033.1 thiamine-phosphate diphosphorylase [Candidatus Thiodiazotropha endoloripes]MCG7940925.1 thiamine phosphate synthase [Candidatus Thiodiazotropha lotti]MCG7989247.1 thiamine phosphate synthase [Candidatus Thiodiazotropha lotti]MCG8002733.1 thiamine phosphate synthase [Candidatus Thiodiazotropha lotti]